MTTSADSMTQTDRIKPPRAADYYANGFWRAEDLWTCAARAAERRPDGMAVICGGREIAFAALIDGSARLGEGLRRNGIGAGDVVVIHARNSIESLQALLACAWLGAVMAPVPPMFSEAQITAVADSAGVRAVFCLGDDKEVRRAIDGARDAAGVDLIVAPDTAGEGVGGSAGGRLRTWSSLQASSAGTRRPVDPDSLAMLLHSSGTTGVPKGVMHSANTVRYAIERRAAMHDVGPDDVCIVICQFGFAGGIVFGLLTGSLLGLTSVVMRHWRPEDALALIEKHGVSYGLFMPTHVHDLLASPVLETTDVSSLRRAAMGGLSAEARIEVRRRLCPKPMPGYGMSECLGNSSCSPADPDDKAINRDGRPYPGTELRVVGGDGRLLPAGEAGAVEVRGPSRCLGYYKAPDLNRAAFTPDGFFRTGDRGVLDAQGYLSFVGREKDIIRRGAVTIVPGDVEAALMTHPNIRKAALVGLPDPRLGERPCACIVTRDGTDLSLESVTRLLEDKGVARYMWPESVAMFDDFPQTPSLKVKKPALIESLLARGPTA
jgi:cyclohexanecarboxylate-CoA ligase